MDGTWDCIVIGAGAAGLSAALVLGRARRPTLLVDAGEQSNLAAEGVGGFLGADGMAPAAFYERSRESRTALAYPATSVLEQALARRVLARNDNDAATAAGAPTADLLAAYVRGAASGTTRSPTVPHMVCRSSARRAPPSSRS